MNQEIERKFLINGEFLKHTVKSFYISQGYLSSSPSPTVRVRIRNQEGFLTIKGKQNSSGITRLEWEKSISIDDAKELMKLCENNLIEKTRYIIPELSGLYFEVDVFHGQNKGLIMAEIELPAEEYSFTKPDWLGEEVTHDLRYYNAYLSKNPYINW